MQTDEPKLPEELKEKLSSDLLPLFRERDGPALLLQKLPETYPPAKIAQPTDEQRAWELVGLHYFSQNRLYEALPIFRALYSQMLAYQELTKTRIHKGMPLVWMRDCYIRLGFPVHAKRYAMLTLCEDAIREEGTVSPNTTGIYFRLVWQHGLSDAELKRYAQQVYDLAKSEPDDSLFSERILQKLDRGWLSELPSPQEALVYVANRLYLNKLLANLGDTTGETLEYLADYVLSCMPGCRTARRRQSWSTDYDIVCSMEGAELDFRSELGRYFVCECKDWNSPADVTTFAKFCRVLDSTKSRFGILFSKNGISGQGKTVYAVREQLKVFQDRGMVIVVVDEQDLRDVATGVNFISLLRAKYEAVRLDLRDDDS